MCLQATTVVLVAHYVLVDLSMINCFSGSYSVDIKIVREDGAWFTDLSLGNMDRIAFVGIFQDRGASCGY